MLITCRLKILDFRANDRSLSTSPRLRLLLSRCAAFKNEQWPSPLLPYPLGTQIRKWEGTRQHPISSIGRLDAFASADVHSHFNIEGATNHFPPRIVVKCRHRCFGTLSVLRGDSGNRHASTRSLLKTYQMHLLQCVPIPTSILKELRTIPSPRSVRNAIVAASVPSSAYNNITDIKQDDVEL